jgi:hypothetical protein
MVRECRLSSLRFATLNNLFQDKMHASIRSAYLTVIDDEHLLYSLGQLLIMVDG